MEQDTKRVLVSKNMNKKKLIASTTKIMTGIIAVESGKLNKTVTVTDKVLESYGSNIYLSIGEKMKLKDMVYGLMMQSGNDAALMIADYLGGEEKFVKMMNKKAKQIGMKNTTFSNPHGLDEKTKNSAALAAEKLLLNRDLLHFENYFCKFFLLKLSKSCTSTCCGLKDGSINARYSLVLSIYSIFNLLYVLRLNNCYYATAKTTSGLTNCSIFFT